MSELDAPTDNGFFVLTDRWKTHFGPLHTTPMIAKRVDRRLYPVAVLAFHPRSPLPSVAMTTQTSPAAPAVVTAAQASSSKFSVEWQKLVTDDDDLLKQVPVRDMIDLEDGKSHLVTLGSSLPNMTSSSEPTDDGGTEADLQIDRIEPSHLPRALVLEYELFGDDSSLLADYAAGIAIGYCAIDRRNDTLVGHVVIELVGELQDTLMYTTFATNDVWRGRGVAKAIVSSLHQWAFLQPAIVNGRMHVRGGHAEIIGLYRHYGFDLLEHDADKDGELVPYDDGQQPVVMGGPLRFDVFAKRLAWPWKSREELVAAKNQQ